VTYRFRDSALRVTRVEMGSVAYYVVEDPVAGCQHRLYEAEFEVAKLLDGKRSAEKVAQLVNKKRKLTLEAVDVERFAQQLLALGFVEGT
jgi:hypothetical protein